MKGQLERIVGKKAENLKQIGGDISTPYVFSVVEAQLGF